MLYHGSKHTALSGDCHVLRVDLTEAHPTRVQSALRKLAQGTLSDTDVVAAAKAVSAGVVGRALARNAVGAVVLHEHAFSTLAYFATGPMYEVLGAARESARYFLRSPYSVEQLLEQVSGRYTMRDYGTFPYRRDSPPKSSVQDTSACPLGITAPPALLGGRSVQVRGRCAFQVNARAVVHSVLGPESTVCCPVTAPVIFARFVMEKDVARLECRLMLLVLLVSYVSIIIGQASSWLEWVCGSVVLLQLTIGVYVVLGDIRDICRVWVLHELLQELHRPLWQGRSASE